VLGQPDAYRVAQQLQRFGGRAGWNPVKSAIFGLVSECGQASQRATRLDGPFGVGVGFGDGGQLADEVGAAQRMSGRVGIVEA